MRHTVIHNQSLREQWEGTGDGVSPEDARSVDGSCHHEIAEAPLMHDVAQGWGVNDDGERRAIVWLVHCLVAAGGNNGAE